MARRVILSAIALCALTAGCISPMQDFHGYSSDDIQPSEIQPGIDTRASVLAQLGSPSTESIFDENTWFYISTQRERVAYMTPRTKERTVTAIQFSEENVVDEVVTYDETDGQIIAYASKETPTRGRELNVWEQLFGNIGAIGVPRTNETTPGNPTGRR